MVEMYIFKDNINSVLIDLDLVDLANEIDRIATDVGCKIIPCIEEENKLRLVFAHDDMRLCRFMTYLAKRYIDNVMELNKLVEDKKENDLDLSGLNIEDKTIDKYRIKQ